MEQGSSQAVFISVVVPQALGHSILLTEQVTSFLFPSGLGYNEEQIHKLDK